jgi:membrane dipeptidase
MRTTLASVFDCHSDVSIDVYRRRRAGEHSVLKRIHLPAYREGGVVGAVYTVGGDSPQGDLFGEGQAYRSTVALLDALEADVSESDGSFGFASSAEEVRALIDDGVFAIVLALEGAKPLEGDLARLEWFHRRGVRIIGLTWNSRNELAVGLDSGPGGLTPFGVEAVAAMNEFGILIDLSHAAPQTFWDVAETSAAPLYASHSNAKTIRDHSRNLDDEQLRAIADSRGVIGICLYADFVSQPPVSVSSVVAQINYIRDSVGTDGIAIGADYLDYDLEAIAKTIRESAGYAQLTAFFPEGLETVASTQNLVAAMTRQGYEQDQITQIVGGGNFLRLFYESQDTHVRA